MWTECCFQIDELPTDQSLVDLDSVDVVGKCLLIIYIEWKIFYSSNNNHIFIALWGVTSEAVLVYSKLV